MGKTAGGHLLNSHDDCSPSTMSPASPPGTQCHGVAVGQEGPLRGPQGAEGYRAPWSPLGAGRDGGTMRSPECGEGQGHRRVPAASPACPPSSKQNATSPRLTWWGSLPCPGSPRHSFNTLTNHPCNEPPSGWPDLGNSPHIPSPQQCPHAPPGRTGHCWWAEPPGTGAEHGGRGRAGPRQPRAAARLPNKGAIQCRWRGAQDRFRCRPAPRSSSQEKGAEPPPRDANGQRTKGASGRRSGTVPSAGSNLRPRDGPRSG